MDEFTTGTAHVVEYTTGTVWPAIGTTKTDVLVFRYLETWFPRDGFKVVRENKGAMDLQIVKLWERSKVGRKGQRARLIDPDLFELWESLHGARDGEVCADVLALTSQHDYPNLGRAARVLGRTSSAPSPTLRTFTFGSVLSVL